MVFAHDLKRSPYWGHLSRQKHLLASDDHEQNLSETTLFLLSLRRTLPLFTRVRRLP